MLILSMLNAAADRYSIHSINGGSLGPSVSRVAFLTAAVVSRGKVMLV